MLTGTATPPPCDIHFIEDKNTGADGAEQYREANGKDECGDLCVELGDDCVAFDINQNNGDCWIFDDADKAAETEDRDDANHYTKTTICGKSLTLSTFILS